MKNVLKEGLLLFKGKTLRLPSIKLSYSTRLSGSGARPLDLCHLNIYDLTDWS